MADLRYPVGPFVAPSSLSAADRAAALTTLAEFPARLRLACAGLTDAQLDTPYRPGGWNIVGRTPLELVNVADKYFPLRTGDLVQFTPIDEVTYRTMVGQRLGNAIDRESDFTPGPPR